jgi:hypothetical protein
MKHVMVDLETLGTTPDSVILSIGAVRFCLDTGKVDDKAFYASVSVDSNLALGRKLSEDTLVWWFKQDKAAQYVFHEEKDTLEAALESLTEWFGSTRFKPENTLVYSKGADFDIPMLSHAYSQFGWETPWQFWNTRCFRTYSKLPQAARVSAPEAGIKHNALSDAIAQAEHMIAIWRELNKVAA